ncbi:MAG TPA: glycerol-3-phosphate dehydrogenase/oxidase, partial [Acidimicrobiales bacterium]|nr:glycerol-3-phosphate dehydrogenase/oxidase [Acidimicrobiales bacterium]
MSEDRADALARLRDGRFDVVVVGGGITGCGVALDAAARGLSVALVERRDLASGTSSKSSKLVHGGLRYLQQGDVQLVREALKERQRLRENAPHLVRVLPFLIPIFSSDGVVNPKLAGAFKQVLRGYDLAGGRRIGKTYEQISADDAVERVRMLRRDRTVGAFVYYDAQTDDARLTLAVARTAIDHGATVLTWAPVVDLLKDDAGRAVGVRVQPVDATEPIDVRATVVVNATGVWSDELRTLDEGADPDSIRPAKGIHITVPWAKVGNDIACVFPVPGDKRSIFVVPTADKVHTYIGTTDTDYDGPLDDPQCTPEDVRYVLDAMNASLEEPLTEADVTGTWAGLRPLVKSASSARTADLSRGHKVERSTSGIVSIAGGKLTTYRHMAADTVDEVMKAAGKRGKSSTDKLRLHGADGYDAALAVDARLADRYGGDAQAVLALVADDPSLGDPLVDGQPYLRAEAVFAVRHELARTLDDVLTRRI